MSKASKSNIAATADRGTTKATVPEVPNPLASSDKLTAPDKWPDTSSVPTPNLPSNANQLAALVVRDDGATLAQMVAALGWLPHTTRAALTDLKKKGYVISSDKVDGVRTYRGIAPQ